MRLHGFQKIGNTQLTQVFSGSGEPGLHRAQRDVERDRRRLLVKARPDAQLDDLALLARKVFQSRPGVLELPVPIQPPDHLVGMIPLMISQQMRRRERPLVSKLGPPLVPNRVIRCS